ncbi:hypothetical protein L2E82_51259 [Cichorium intybus]|nr:hypothetical protein L2E82_51259 [Cichorium intybus]
MERIEKQFRDILVHQRRNWRKRYFAISFENNSIHSLISYGVKIFDLEILAVIPDLKEIANSMFDSNCGRECSQAFISVQKSIAFRPHQLGVVIIAGMYKVLLDLMPDIENLYSDENGLYIRYQYHSVLTWVGDYLKVRLIELKNTVREDLSNSLVPDGGIHHLTNYMMDAIKSLNNYSDLLSMFLKDDLVGDNQESSSSPHRSPGHEHDSINGNSSSSPLALYFRSLIHAHKLSEKDMKYSAEELENFMLKRFKDPLSEDQDHFSYLDFFSDLDNLERRDSNDIKNALENRK